MHRVTVAVLMFVLAVPSYAQTVTKRVRVGHSLEDVDVRGREILLLDGFEVFAAKSGGYTKILDLHDVGITSHVMGFAWIESERLFAFVESRDRNRMLLCDERGNPMGTRPFAFPSGFVPSHVEGLTWLPKGTPYPNHLALVAYDGGNPTRVEIMTTGGSVVHEIVLRPPIAEGFVGSVEVFGADHLAVLELPSRVWVIDYAGAVVAGPVDVLEATNTEGVVRTPRGIAVADYFSGRVFALDRNLQRVPEDDSHHVLGVKIRPEGIAWNPDTMRYIVTAMAADRYAATTVGFSLPISLDDPVPSFHPAAHGLFRTTDVSYMPDEHKIVVAHRQSPAAILIYEPSGELVEQIDVAAAGGGAALTAALWIPAAHEFYVRFSEPARRLRVLSRTGVWLRDVDMTAAGIATSGVMTLAGNDLVLGTASSVVRTDLNGVVLQTYDPAPLRLPQLPYHGLTAITNGPDAGKFAAFDTSAAEIVIFTLP